MFRLRFRHRLQNDHQIVLFYQYRSNHLIKCTVLQTAVHNIKQLYMQEKACDVINEYVNKLEHFDVEWFRLLVDSWPHKAMAQLDDINHWKSLCNHQFGTDDYTRWYDTAAPWYNMHNNTEYNHMNINAFFEKVYYMHKSKGLHFT